MKCDSHLHFFAGETALKHEQQPAYKDWSQETKHNPLWCSLSNGKGNEDATFVFKRLLNAKLIIFLKSQTHPERERLCVGALEGNSMAPLRTYQIVT